MSPELKNMLLALSYSENKVTSNHANTILKSNDVTIAENHNYGNFMKYVCKGDFDTARKIADTENLEAMNNVHLFI